MRALLAGLLALLFASVASAQNVTVIGPVTPGNIPQFNSATVIKDSGVPAASSVTGPGTSTLNGLPIWANTSGTALADGANQTIAGNYTWSGSQTPTAVNAFLFGSGSTSTIRFASTNTGFANQLQNFNNGTSSTSGTVAVLQTLLNCANCFTNLAINGGASPSSTLSVGAGVTGGLTISTAGSSNINVSAGGTTNLQGTTNASGTFQIGGVTLALPVSIGNGGTGQTTAPAAISALMPTPVRAGDVAYWNGSNWVTLAGNNSGTQILQETAAGVPSWTLAGAGSINVCNGVSGGATCPPPYGFVNCSITATVASNNLTVALKDNSGVDPSAASPCNVYFRNSTLGTGSWTQVTTTGALSFTANSGSTFGATNTSATCRAAASCPFKLWVVGINSGAGLVLGVVDLTNASGIDPLNEATLLTTTACSACATATAIGTVYSTAAQSTKPFVILGYLEWGSGLATAGTYASAPTAIQTLGPGVHKPGDVIQTQVCCVGSVTVVSPTGTTFAAGTTTNITATIAPTMSSNPIRFVWMTSGVNSVTANNNFCQEAFGGTPTAVGPIAETSNAGTNGTFNSSAGGYDTPSSTSALTYAVRCWVTGGTGSFPAVTGNGGYEELQEVMG